MLPEDLEPFLRPYPDDDGVHDDPTQDGFAKACEATLPKIQGLQDRIGDDRDASVGGIGWWAPGPGSKRRILISDCLFQATGSVKRNLVEARLHQLAGREAAQQVSDFYADTVKIIDGQVRPDMRARTRAADELPTHMLHLHEAGFFRAIGSTLDCLGGAIIGVGALPLPILKADLGRVANWLEREIEREEPHPLAGRLHETLTGAEAAGPTGWLAWASDYRNMLVHRARRMGTSQFVGRNRDRRPLINLDGDPIIRVDVVDQLAQDPGRSDLETFLGQGWAPAKRANGDPIAPVLEEPAATTIEGIFRSTVDYVEAIADDLIDIWVLRREQPDLVEQPRKQWPDVPSGPPTNFDGYKRGELRYAPEMLISNLALHTQLSSALMLGDFASRWDELD